MNNGEAIDACQDQETRAIHTRSEVRGRENMYEMLPFSNSTHASSLVRFTHQRSLLSSLVSDCILTHFGCYVVLGCVFPKTLTDLFCTLRPKNSYPGPASRKGGTSDTHNQVQTLFVVCVTVLIYFQVG